MYVADVSKGSVMVFDWISCVFSVLALAFNTALHPCLRYLGEILLREKLWASTFLTAIHATTNRWGW